MTSSPSSGGAGGSSSSAATPSRRHASTARARRSRSRSTSEWAARFKEQAGTTVNYQGIGSGGGIAQFTAGTVDFGATDSAMKRRGGHGRAKKKGDAGPHPDACSARSRSPTTSSGVEEGPQARRRDGRRHLPRQGHEVERPGDRAAELGRRSCPTPTSRSATAPTSRARRRTSPSSSPTTRPTWKSGPGVDKTVKWPTGTGAKGNDGVAGLRQADRRRDRLRRAGLRPAEQLHVRRRQEQGGPVRRPDARVDLGRRRGRRRCPRTCASARSTRRARRDVPDRRRHVPARLPGLVQGRAGRGQGQAAEELARLRARATARRSRRSSSTRRCPAAIQSRRPRPRSTACSATASRDRAELSATSLKSRHQAAPAAVLGAVVARAARRIRSAVGPAGHRGAHPAAHRVLLRPPVRRGASRRSTSSAYFGVHLQQRLERRRRTIFGACRCVVGTLITSAIALVIGVPVAVATALYVTELCPRRLRQPLDHPGRAARRGAVGRLRPLGRLRPDPEAQAGRAVVLPTRSRSCRSSAAHGRGPELLHRRADPGDHDPADRLARSRARSSPRCRPITRRRARARRDALGDDPDGGAAVLARRASRARPCSASAARSARRSR